MIICIGPVCLPLWHLGVIALVLLRPLLDLLRRLCGSRSASDDSQGTPQPDAASAGQSDAQRRPNEPYQRKRGGVTRVKSEAELQGLRDAAEREGVALFLDIGASWCGPCRRIAPVFELLARNYSGLFASVDVDECQDLADLPAALPTFKVYKPNKGVVETLTGANQAMLEALVAKHATRLT